MNSHGEPSPAHYPRRSWSVSAGLLLAALFVLHVRGDDPEPAEPGFSLLDFVIEPGPGGASYPVFSFTRVARPYDYDYEFETSTRLADWTPLRPQQLVEISALPGPIAGTQTIRMRVDLPVEEGTERFFRMRRSLPFARQAFDGQASSIDASTNVISSGITHDRRMGRSAVNLRIENTSGLPLDAPIFLVIQSISEASVSVLNHDSLSNPDGFPQFDFTGQIPGPQLDPGEMTAWRPVLFDNPDLVPFTITVSVVQGDPPSGTPSITIEIAPDAEGRTLIGIGDGVLATIRAMGTDPEDVDLSQADASPGRRGQVFFGESGMDTDASVTTSGGPDNTVAIRLRGDPARPSAFAGDLDLVVSQAGSTISTLRVTVLRILTNTGPITLINDSKFNGVVTSTPALDKLPLTSRFSRSDMNKGPLSYNPNAPTTLSVTTQPFGGPQFITGSDGTAPYSLQRGPGGQGWVFGDHVHSSSGATAPLAIDLTESSSTGSGGSSGGPEPYGPTVPEDPYRPIPPDPPTGPTGSTPPNPPGPPPPPKPPKEEDPCPCNSVLPYSGEKRVTATDLVIKGRGLDYRFGRAYRSQGSFVAPVSTQSFGAMWCMSYADDMLVADGPHIVVVRSNFRTDLFMAGSTPGTYDSPMEFYQQLTVNGDGDFELRDANGQVNTYEEFAHPDLPGRLRRIEDRNGNFMSFLYDEIDPDGVGSNGDEKWVLSTVIDTMGREIRYLYFAATAQFDGAQQLTTVHGNPAAHGRLGSVSDFKGDMDFSGSGSSTDFPGQTNTRTIRFEYDTEGNLASVTGPAVTGTPNVNNFPGGKTTTYTYLLDGDIPPEVTGSFRDCLRHNLLTITPPNEAGGGSASEAVVYGMDPANPVSFDRVISYTMGGVNATGVQAGGTTTYQYQQIAPNSVTPSDPYLRLTITDRNGNVEVNTYSAWDTLLERSESTRGLRTGEPEAFITRYEYDMDKKLQRMTLPSGNTIEYTYDSGNSDRFQQGNRVVTDRTPDARGSDHSSISNSFVYEPIYQQVATVTDPRGLDPGFSPPIPDTGGRSQQERYTTRYFYDYQEGNSGTVLTMLADELNATIAEVQQRLSNAGIALGLGDLNADGDTSPRIGGNVVRREEPAVSLAAGALQAVLEGTNLQPLVTLFRYNEFGQLISVVDAEGNVHESVYFPETDPDGDGVPTPPPADGRPLSASTGGYLDQQITDTTANPVRNSGTNPTPAFISVRYTYDDTGNMVSITDGRGIRSDMFTNELDQVVLMQRATAVPGVSPAEPLPLVPYSYEMRYTYDANDNIVRTDVEDRGDTSNTGGFVSTSVHYDILDRPVQVVEEVDTGLSLLTELRYDANGNRVLLIKPEGNAVSYIYDERDQLFSETRGAVGPAPGTLSPPAGPYDPRGGVPSTITYHYDDNRNVVEQVDAADTDSSAGNSSSMGGPGDVIRYQYDGHDRLVRITDPAGNRLTLHYDPSGNLIQDLRTGPPGGPTPTDTSGSANVDLAFRVYQYDEANRLIRIHEQVFVPAGVVTVRPTDSEDGATGLGKGDLSPGDGFVTTHYEYDRLGRKTFAIQDDADVSQTRYDGADRIIRTIDPAGNTVEYAYDAGNNVVEKRETDTATAPGVPAETFLTTTFYDSLNRPQMEVDNLGHTLRYSYDSRSNLVASADAEGPVTGAVITRRAFPPAPLTVDSINDPGNVVRYYYDGLSRPVREERVLTSSGQGDGVNSGADADGVKGAVPPPDLSQGGGDGLMISDTTYDGNSLTIAVTDDNGFQTQYTYDNLDRRILETRGVATAAVNPVLYRTDPSTTVTYTYDPDDNIVQTTDDNGSVSTCTYDALNRRISCTIVRGPGVTGSTAITHEYDGLSRKTLTTDNNDPGDADDDSATAYTYDSLSRIVEERHDFGTEPTRAVSKSWRAHTLCQSVIYPNGRVVEYTYDALDRRASITDSGAGISMVEYDYIGPGRLLERRYPQNGTRATHLDDTGAVDIGYDGARRGTVRRDLRADDSVITGFEYTYDRMDNRRSELKLHRTDNSELYSYDSSYRLTGIERGTLNGAHTAILVPTPLAGATQAQNWTLDGSSNWNTLVTTTGGVAAPELRQHSSYNEITDRNGTAVDSDANGNTMDDGVFLYQYDARNRLRTVTRIAGMLLVAEYDYDGMDRRVREIVTNSGALDGTAHFIHDREQVIEERDGAGILTRQFVCGTALDEVFVLDRNLDADDSATGLGDARFFYHVNTPGSIFALTDGSAVVAERYQYDAYGRAQFLDDAYLPLLVPGVSAVGNPYTYTSSRFDAATGLHYLRRRFLSPELGRFLSRDPLGPSEGLNFYEYATSNPIRFTDPSGLDVADAIKWFIEAYKAGEGCVTREFDLGRQLARGIASLGGSISRVRGSEARDFTARLVRFVRNKVDVSVSGEICVDRCLCVTARIAGRVKITFYSNIVLDVSGTATASAQAKKCPGCPWELSYELCLAVSLDAGVDAWIASTWGKVSLQACYSSRRGFYALVSYEVGWSTFWDSDKYGGSTCLYGNCP